MIMGPAFFVFFQNQGAGSRGRTMRLDVKRPWEKDEDWIDEEIEKAIPKVKLKRAKKLEYFNVSEYIDNEIRKEFEKQDKAKKSKIARNRKFIEMLAKKGMI
jgi:hypothetical protein